MKSGSDSAGDSKETDPSLSSNESSDREKESDNANLGWDRNAGDQRDTESDCRDDEALDDQQSDLEDNRNNEKPKAPCHFFHYFGSCSNDNCGFAHSTPILGNGARESGISNQSTPKYILIKVLCL